jgi:hypothetical protein
VALREFYSNGDMTVEVADDMEAFRGWVGECERCHRPWFVLTVALYVNGKRKGWGSGRPAACTYCYTQVPLPQVRPYEDLAQQAPYRAAFAMGGEVAVWDLLGINSEPF